MKKAILCVDDEVIILIALTAKLRKQYGVEYSIESATSAREALDLIRDLTAKGVVTVLVITDWLMPGMNGDDLLRALKKEYPSIRGIMITGQADRDSIEKVKAEGLTSHIIDKPWDEQILQAALRDSLTEK